MKVTMEYFQTVNVVVHKIFHNGVAINFIGVIIKVGGPKTNSILEASFNAEVHFAFFNVPIVYISRGECS